MSNDPLPTLDEPVDLIEQIEQVVRAESARLRHLACGLLGGDVGDAEDAVQDAWHAVHLARGQFRGEASLSTWVLHVARGRVIDSARRRARRRRDETVQDVAVLEPRADARDEPTRRLERAERIDAVRRALAGLPLIYREVLTLRSFSGLRYAEIAAQLDVPVGTVRSRIAAGSALLARTLRDIAGETP